MAFCGNVLELVEKHKVLDDKEEFLNWTEFGPVSSGNPNLQVYIEKSLIPELMEKDLILIDAIIGKTKSSKKIGLLFIRKENDVYG